jgi:short-subunit dehydrogenase
MERKMEMTETALITGASAGIGLELARIFAKDGYNLVLVARNKKKLEELAGELNASHSIQICVLARDLSLPGAAQEIFDEVQQAGITVDMLVNNAGIQVYGEFKDSDLARQMELIQVNLVSLTQLSRLFIPGMVSRRRGRIMNLGSTGSYAPGVLNAVYCATKAYILSFSEGLAAELYGSGVTVTAVCPGGTETEFANRAGIENVRLFRYTMSARRVAELGYRAFMKGRQVIVTGLANQLQVTFYLLAQIFMPLFSPAIVRRAGYFLMGRRNGAV